MRSNQANVRGRGGFASIYVVMTSMLLVPMVGLAIDFGMLYNVKAKLQAAVDAAAIGAGALVQSSTDITNPTTILNIQAVALQFYNANYPNHYFGSRPAVYNTVPGNGANGLRFVKVYSSVYVPLLFLRVLHVSDSTVAAIATVNIRFVAMMVVVDRSGSVWRAGNDSTIRSALNDFIVNTPASPTPGHSIFVDGRDYIGMVSFGTTYSNDFVPPVTTFRSGASKMSSAIINIPFATGNSTNTAEGLYQAYTRLRTLNQIGALNVIVLLTDGRPSAFTQTVTPGGTCTNKVPLTGVVDSPVGTWPPPTTGTTNGLLQNYTPPPYSGNLGNPPGSGTDAVAVSDPNCKWMTDTTQAYLDFALFAPTDYQNNSTTGTFYSGNGRSMSNPRNVRYGAFNAADNMATRIRTDTTINPVLFVIGLNENNGEEPLDADWLARVANDPNYKDGSGNSVFQQGQSSGVYYNVTSSNLTTAFEDIASQVLRLAQ